MDSGIQSVQNYRPQSVTVETVRARALQAAEYYHNNILQNSNRGNTNIAQDSTKDSSEMTSGQSNGLLSKDGAKDGLPKPVYNKPFNKTELRASYSERISPRVNLHQTMHALRMERYRQQQQQILKQMWPKEDCLGHVIVNHHTVTPNKPGLYRSNSSLDLDHLEDLDDSVPLRRDYGSASSIDVMSSSGDSSFFAMLQDYKNDNPDQRSPAPAKIHEYLRGKVDFKPSIQNASNILANGSDSVDGVTSPKLKNKFQKFRDKEKLKLRTKSINVEQSLFRKLRGSKTPDASETSSKGSDNSNEAENKSEEKLRKKAFAHYDCQSITVNLAHTMKNRTAMNQRRNTTTGASAASITRVSTPQGSLEDLRQEETDNGDGKSNELILSCPFFRNELGGEQLRVIGFCHSRTDKKKSSTNFIPLMRSNTVSGLSVIDNPYRVITNECFQNLQNKLIIELIDRGALYYRHFFHNQEHQNYFGLDDHLGPVAVSIRREKVEDNSHTAPLVQYRLIIRTSELETLRGMVLEDALPGLSRHSGSTRGIPVKEILEYVAPELQISCLRQATPGLRTEEQLLKLDEQGVPRHYKIGIMYCKSGQSTEEEMYNNEHAAGAFDEFLDMLGQRVRLKGFEKYRAQLDNKSDSTGTYSLYATCQGYEVMFHVSTMLPYTPNNRQQLLRKRHIGNDIVTLVFQEPGALPFTPKTVRSHFQHVFIVVRVHNPNSENIRYSVAVSRSKEVPPFGPPIPECATFPKSKEFTELLLTKVINAENAAHRSEKFVAMATRTRQEYLKDLATNYVTSQTIESSTKFSVFSLSTKRKEKPRPRFIPDTTVRGAIVWHVQVEDFSQNTLVDCFLGISVDMLVLIEEVTKAPIFATPCRAVIGWTSLTNSLRIYYHKGEYIIIRTKDPEVDEIQEIVSRLSAVTQGCETHELILRRNSVGQLGFHTQSDGVLTDVESFSFAYQAGLRPGSRLVEICKVSVCSLNHEEMMDLLKTSVTITLTVIPPFDDGVPRRGCEDPTCRVTQTSNSPNYDNLLSHESEKNKLSSKHSSPKFSKTNSKMDSIRYDPKASPPRSSSSSGYGSSKSLGSSLDSRFSQDSSSRSNHVRTNSNVVRSSWQIQRFQQKQKEEFLEHYPPTTQAPSLGNSSQSSEEKWYDTGYMSETEGNNSQPKEIISSSQPVATMVNYYKSLAEYNNKQHTLPRTMPKLLDSEERRQALNMDTRSDTLSSSASDSTSSSLTHPRDCRHKDMGSLSQSPLSNSPEGSITGNRRRKRPEGMKRNDANLLLSNRDNRQDEALNADLVASKFRPGISGLNRPPASSIQEDLIKLINPDTLDGESTDEMLSSDDTQHPVSESSVSSGSANSRSQRSATANSKLIDDVIFTTARPAQVVNDENRLSKEDRLSPRATVNSANGSQTKLNAPRPEPPLPLPDAATGLNWSNLVDTATKAFEGLNLETHGYAVVTGKVCSSSDTRRKLPDEPTNSKVPHSSLEEPQEKLNSLEAKITQLQGELSKEREEKADLEDEVQQLREENLRLQEESQTAAAQLRRFTEWFFNTIDRH